VVVGCVLFGNGSAYGPHFWMDVCGQLGITVTKTRSRRPQTNGKIERFHCTMGDGWAYAGCYRSKPERWNAMADWIHSYNHHRPHSVSGNQPLFTNAPASTPRSVSGR
ncbi:integrase core domain-containing protein, partial [Schaalia odontolytica]